MKAKFLAAAVGGVVAILTICATTQAQTTRTWDGGGVGGTVMDTAVNWSGDAVPTGAAPGDTAQWDGTVPGDLSLTYATAAGTSPLATGNGIHINILGSQTGALTINQSSTTNALRLQNITIASGAGAFTLGGDGTTNAATFGAGGVDVFTWTNNSSNTATISSDVFFAFGGGDNDNTLTLTGSGNWLFNGHFGGSPPGTGSMLSTTKSGSGTMTITSDTSGFNMGSVLQGAGQVFVKAGLLEIDSGGLLRALSTDGGDFASIGQNGTDVGTMTVKGSGQFIVNGDLNVGDVGSSQGTLNIQDSANVTVSINGFFVGSANGAGSTASGIVNHSGGTLQRNATGDGFVIGGRIAGATGTGTYNLSGGTVTNAGNAWIGGFGTGTVNHSAGDWNNAGSVSIGRQTGSTGTYNLNGGTLTAASVIGGTGTGTFNFNGGTLKAGASSATFMNGLTTANVRNGGAVIDTNNFDVTVSQALVHSTIGGDNATDGGLQKIGAGKLTLSGANTYNGPTAVNGGTLAVTGSLNNSSAVSVASSATLDGTGSVGATNVAVGGSLANGNGGTGTLTMSSLTFAGAATVNANVGGATPIAVTGVLDTTPVGGQVTINGTGTWANGPNNLISYGSFPGGLIGDFALGTITGLNARQTSGGLVTNGNNIALSVTGDSVRWTGLAGNEWSTNVIGGSKNWRLVTAGTATDYIENDAVLFDDTATGLTVDINTSTVNPNSVTFNNTTKSFTINSSVGAGIGGATALTKNGTNSVTISANNSYSGLTTINAGTLTLSGANTTTGGTAFNGGTLNLNNSTALGTGVLTIGTGGAKTLDNTSGAAITMFGDNAQSWNADFVFAGTVSGTHDLDMGLGAVTVGGAGNRAVTVTNGTLTVGELRTGAGQGFDKQGAGTLVLTSTGNSGNGAGTDGSVINGPLNVAAGTLQYNRTEEPTNHGDLTVGGLTGSGRIVNGSAGGRWIHLNNSGDFVFNGLVESGGSGNLGFYKTGSGSQTLTGNNTILDTLTANAGTLVLSGNNTLGAVVVNAGTLRLAGANTVTAAMTVNAGGNLIVAHPSALGNTLRVNVLANNSSASLTFATNTDTTVATPIGLGTFSTLNIISDRATPGAAVDRTMTVLTAEQGGGGIGGGAINFTAGANVTSGVGRITFNQFGVGAGADTTTTLNPTGVNLTLPAVSKFNNATNQTLNLGGTTSDNRITGAITNGTAPAFTLTKSDTSTWSLAGASTYTGGTTINGGTLLVNNTTGSGTGTGAVTVNNGGTLGGTGIIETSTAGSNVIFNAGSSLAPGASAGTLRFNLGTNLLNLSGLTSGNAGGLKFELATPATSDRVEVTNANTVLSLGTLDFSDFTFTNLGGVTPNTDYTLFSVVGAYAATPGTLAGTFSGFNATLDLSSSSAVVLKVGTAAANLGDFDLNSRVDAADYVYWRENYGDTPRYNEWKANFGNTYPGSSGGSLVAGGNASLVPEPATCVSLLMLCAITALISRRRA